MKRVVFIFGALVLVMAAADDADSPAQQVFIRARARIRENMRKVPRYTCVETVARTQSTPQYGGNPPASCPLLIASRDTLTSAGRLVWHDRLRLDVAVGEKSEMFSWAGAKTFENGDLTALTSSGSTGSGDFGAFLASVFGGDAEHFTFTGEKDLPFGRFAAFDYTVPLLKSHYSYATRRGTEGTVAYHGSFYVVPATGELKRLIVQADDFPSGEICRVHDTMDYSTIKIGSGDFLLPDVSTMVVLYRNGEESRNQIHYSGCHEFTGQTTIRFDDEDDPKSASNVAKAELKALPPGTHIRVRIDPPIDTATAAAGDPITGVVERDVKQKGVVLVRNTDKLNGRILRLEQFMLPQPHWLVAIRFEALERDGVEQPLSFKPVDDGDRSGLTGPRRIQWTDVPVRPEGAGVFYFADSGNLVLNKNFHSEWATK